MPRRSTKDPAVLKEAARKLVAGHTVKSVMLEAGYSENVAKNGMATVPQVIKGYMNEILLEQGKKFSDLGRKLDPSHVEQAIAGKLYANMLEGESAGNEAAKLLGTMRRYNAFEKDSMTGVIVLASPNLQPAGKPLRELDAHDLDMLDGEVVEQKQLSE